MKLFCAHRYDLKDIHRFSDDVVAGLCWKCNRVYQADCGLNLPGQLQPRPQVKCQRCDGTGLVHENAP